MPSQSHIGSRTSRAIGGMLTSFLQYGLATGLQVVLSPVILHVAGQETLGAYGALAQVIGYLSLADLGFGVALSRYMAQAFGYDDQRRRFGEIFTTGRTFYLASNTAAAVFALALSTCVGSLFSLSGPTETHARIGLWVLAVWSVLRTPLAVYGGALIATQNLAAANIIGMIGNTLRLILSLGLVLMGYGLMGLMLAGVFSEIVGFSLQRRQYRRIYPGERFGWGIPNWQLLREMLGFGVGYLLVIIGGQLTFGSDNVVVGYLFGGVTTSVYYTTWMPTFLSITLIWRITDNAMPAFNELYAERKIERLQNAYSRLMKYGLILSLGLGLGTLALNRPLIGLWVGPEQYAGKMMTIALAVFAVGTVLNHVNALVLVVYGAVRLLSVVCIVSGVSKLGLSFILGERLGLQGVMVASAVVETISAGVLCFFGLSLMQIDLPTLWWKVVVPALGTGLFVVPVIALIGVYRWTMSWPMLMISCLVFVAVWVIGIVKMGLDRGELVEFWGYFGRIRQW